HKREIKWRKNSLFLFFAAWDQSDKFVKIYLTLKDVHKIPSENVQVTFTERSFSVLVKELDGKNHQMNILNLLQPINEKDSYKRIYTALSTQILHNITYEDNL
uniref:Calcyclin binding protein n=1 Tax=Neogobius melanostomus TaxID=47308 RepID=A0A8C6SII3_9GOBI